MNRSQHLAISFPIWLLHDTPGHGAYHDLEQTIASIAERGFNCVRCDDGAGLIDFTATPPRGTVTLQEPFTGLTRDIRQSWCVGDGGDCDLLERLDLLFQAARRHHVLVILSSWYYLHTCWYCGDERLNARLHLIPNHEKFRYFAEQLDHLLTFLRQRGHLQSLAFAEILNEADGLYFVGGYGNAALPEHEALRRSHEDAIAFLRQRHPDVLFAYDSYTPATKPSLFPRNCQVWNLHSYYLWPIYALLQGRLLAAGTDVTAPSELACAQPYLKDTLIPLDAVRATRNGRIPAAEDWYRRVWLYAQIDPRKIPQLEQAFIRKFLADRDQYLQRLRDALRTARQTQAQLCPQCPLVLGESCSFPGSNLLQWEEHCDDYWQLLQDAAHEIRQAGFWGAAIRTCSAPDDPAWNLRKDDFIRINRILTEA